MAAPAPRVGIVGGGVLGTSLALRLAQAGAKVTVIERGPSLGGLAGSFDFDGHEVDRFYHVITPADERMIAMAGEVGLGDQLRFNPVGAGFFADGEMHDFNGVGDLLRFSPLSPPARLRLGLFVAQCQLRSSYDKLETIPLEDWLRRICGKQVWERIWKPLLDSRFDGDPSGLPATYLWARTRRMSGARESGSGGEKMGHIVGGHQRLIDAMVARARELGVETRTDAAVSGLALNEDGAVTGVELDGETLEFDLTIPTLQPPALRFLLPERHQGLLAPYPERWLGCVCAILKVKRPLLPYYAINITEQTPITSAVETTQVLGTDHTDGLDLVYLPKYCAPDAVEQSEDDESVYRRFSDYLARLSPGFDREQDVVAWTVQRAKLVEPVHQVRSGEGPRVAPIWPGVDGLALASNAQIYPYLLNGDSVMGFAEQVAGEVGERLGLDGRPDGESARKGLAGSLSS
ncbi:MAG TPA: FAD-dependent oxidoreductase [Solirubrobacterales bacterium]|jgi:protoporphyrinogen oxidase|nr:FAD-dependent oxidoreductase [Solirubrobacterales bacterium]